MNQAYRKIWLIAAIGAGSLNLSGQKPNTTAHQRPALEDTIQYSLGIYMMQALQKTGFSIDKKGVEFRRAIDDILSGKKTMVDPATVEARLIDYQKKDHTVKGRQQEQLLFEQMKLKPNFTTLPGGTMYTLVKAGQGPVPGLQDTVLINLNSRLADGTVLDDVSQSKRSYLALTSDMIPGLREVILKMKEGSVVTVVIPSSQAYGEKGTSVIPPYSALIYDIALVQVRKHK